MFCISLFVFFVLEFIWFTDFYYALSIFKHVLLPGLIYGNITDEFKKKRKKKQSNDVWFNKYIIPLNDWKLKRTMKRKITPFILINHPIVCLILVFCSVLSIWSYLILCRKIVHSSNSCNVRYVGIASLENHYFLIKMFRLLWI